MTLINSKAERNNKTMMGYDEEDIVSTSVGIIIREKALDLLKKQYDPLSMNRKTLDKITNNEIVNFNLFL